MLQGQQMQTDYKFAIQTFMDDPNVDIIMPWFVFQDDPLEENIVDILSEFNKQRKKTNINRRIRRTLYTKDG